MLIISNHVTKAGLLIPKDALVRVNLAWFNSTEEVNTTMKDLYDKQFGVYLDYPKGRTKPPTPTIMLADATEIANKWDNVKYFAVSNAETVNSLQLIKNVLRPNIELVPKVESVLGVHNIEDLVEGLGIKTIMLDKEDLWTDILHGPQVEDANTMFNINVELARDKCKEFNVYLLELQGVVFA